jgi:hypothetical protein
VTFRRLFSIAFSHFANIPWIIRILRYIGAIRVRKSSFGKVIPLIQTNIACMTAFWYNLQRNRT